MSSRYSKAHYEDVARILVQRRAPVVGEGLGRIRNAALTDVANDFADLFAADNPVTCSRCRTLKADARQGIGCRYADEYHKWVGGFNRERFLVACGLEPNCPLCSCLSKDGDVHLTCADTEQAYSDYVAGKIAGEFE